MGDQTWWEKLIAVMPEFDGNGADEAQVRYFDSLDRLFALVERANQAPPPGPRFPSPRETRPSAQRRNRRWSMRPQSSRRQRRRQRRWLRMLMRTWRPRRPISESAL
ncbi:MAG: hypothetical protein NTZ05_20670 [Chloroflexi bacterium]|nr:hypothetical protein [Chloroflexota bacterium]